MRGLKRTFVLICSTNVLFFVEPLCFIYEFYLGEKLITQPLTLASIPPILFVSPLLFSPFTSRRVNPVLMLLLVTLN